MASYKFLAGRNYSPISWNDFFAFILLIVATLVYNDKTEIKKESPILNIDIIPDLDESTRELVEDESFDIVN